MLQMPKWLQDLEPEIEDQDRATVETEMGEGEVVLGELPEDLRALFFIRRVMYRKMKELHAEHKEFCTGEGGPACEAFETQTMRLRDQHDLVERLFWRSVREQFEGVTATLGLRSDWQVVTCPDDDDEPSILDIFGGGRLVVMTSTMPFGLRTDRPFGTRHGH